MSRKDVDLTAVATSTTALTGPRREHIRPDPPLLTDEEIDTLSDAWHALLEAEWTGTIELPVSVAVQAADDGNLDPRHMSVDFDDVDTTGAATAAQSNSSFIVWREKLVAHRDLFMKKVGEIAVRENCQVSDVMRLIS